MTTRASKASARPGVKDQPSRRAKAFLEKFIGEPLTLGLLLRSPRQSDEETLGSYAERLGISPSHLLDIEKGRKAVGPARAAHFALALGHSKRQFVELALQDLLMREGVSGRVRFDVA